MANFRVQVDGYRSFRDIEDAFLLTDSRVLPLGFTCFSLAWQVFSATFRAYRSNQSGDGTVPISHTSIKARFDAHVNSYGGYTIFGFMVARLVGALTLVYLSAITPMQGCEMSSGCNLKFRLEYCLPIAFLYCSLLAVIALVSRPWSTTAIRHTNLVLLSTLGVYMYRDVWPLATYALEPADKEEGRILWTKIAVLVIAAVIIPLFIPNAYVPADPKNPMPIMSRELTDSWISRLTYIYIDPVIISANRVSHLSVDQLLPLLDVDRAQYLSDQAFPYLDPFSGAKRRHLFFGLLYVFRHEYLFITLALFSASLCTFVGPFALKQILGYIETNGVNAVVKPWLWIVLILITPLLNSVIEHWNLYLQTVVLVRLQGLLTQLVFEHSLRIRLKAGASANSASSTNPSPSTSSSSSVEQSRASTPVDSQLVDDEPGHTDRSENESQTTQTSTTVASQGPSRQGTLKGSTKGKAKAAQDNIPPSQPEKKHTGDAENLIGKINNLVTSDLDTIVDATDFMGLVVSVPVEITLSVIFLQKVLGWSAYVGLFTTLALSPVAGYIAKLSQNAQETKMKKTDARVQNISEAVGVIRMIKLFGWEDKMSKKLDEKREEELAWVWKLKVINVFNMLVSIFVPTFAMLLTYATYTVIMKEELSASKVFSSMVVFSILRGQLSRITWKITSMIEGKVSLDRLTRFLYDTEVLDQFADKNNDTLRLSLSAEDDEENPEIGFRDAMFSWSVESDDGTLTPSSRNFRLRVEELLFKRNCINMIVGPTGSGKTSILMALLGEMHFMPSQPNSWFNLPRRGGVAFAAQESWVQSATIRENILFGSPYDEARYKKVVYQCGLEHDLELFDAGDATEVGERGLTLSGGQKARITLARAIYSKADIILLDDVLAALDVHTSAWIVDKCFRGDLARGRTILLVTHNIALVGPVAGFVVSLGLDGSVQTQGTEIDAILENDPRLASEVEQEKKALEATKEEVEAPPRAASDGKLVVAEEIVEGHITWKSIKLLLSALGGRHPIAFFLIWIMGIVLMEIVITMQTWFLGFWGSQYETHAPSEVNLSFYLTMFSSLILVQIVIFGSLNLYYSYHTVSASRAIHAKLMDSVFGSTFRWLDETPTGRIIARCTQDIRTVDNSITQSLFWVVDQSIGALTKLAAIALITPLFIFPGIGVGALGLILGNWYLKAQLSIKREMSNARSPLLGHFTAAIHGLVSIRAYGAQEAFRKGTFQHIDHYSRIARTSWNVNRWVGIRMDFLGAIFTASLAFYQVYGKNVSASNTGFSLDMAMDFCSYIFALIRLFNNLEVQSNSLERIQGYLDIDHEPKSTDAGKPPAAWPTSGDLRVENLSARYSQSGPKVLHSVSFHINSGQRIGIVGRTGSGKSSLTLALLRCIVTEGTVYYDGIPTDKVNVDALRSSITIIPQTPELLSGTLRQNLDPFEQNDDATLNDALRAAGLFSLQELDGEAHITLDSKVAGGGSNLSVGQRQIIALARAMVRGSKLLILDEATSAIDYKTDSIIQNTLRSQLGPDVTVITVAHRLQTIMDADRIMVLENGNIVEFDSPEILLTKEKGLLRALVDSSGDKDSLYKLARVDKT